MFDSSKLSANNNLIDECIKLIKDHNKLSYKKVNLELSSIRYDNIKSKNVTTKDAITKEIINFYNQYMYQMITMIKLKSIIDSISYTTEDLSLHIDRSSDSIVQIFSSLTENRLKLVDYHDQIINNISNETNVFADHIKDLLTEETDFDEIIKTIFLCMNQKDTNGSNRPFIQVGRKLLETIYKSDLLNNSHSNLILKLNDNLKQMILNANDDISSFSQTTNHLQTFGIVPDEGVNVGLKEIIDRLFGLDIKPFTDDANIPEALSKILKLIAADTGLSTGLIIIISKNVDNYFDMSNLKTIKTPIGSSGVSEKMIKLFDLIKQGREATVKSSELITININDKTHMAYVLWTNDMKLFKAKKNPILQPTINKLIRKMPSKTIEAYNKIFESIITNSRKDDAFSFNKVKYMSFNETVTEESFLEKLESRLVSNILDKINKYKDDNKLMQLIATDAFTAELLSIIDSSKIDLGVHPQLLSAHSHIIYASIANSVVMKIKKDLLSNEKLNKTIVSEIVQQSVKTNDNIYSRVIACYYLSSA